MESTDPELAVLLKDIRDWEVPHNLSKQSQLPKAIPKLNLKDIHMHTEYSQEEDQDQPSQSEQSLFLNSGKQGFNKSENIEFYGDTSDDDFSIKNELSIEK